jgi:CBS domain-containing protein
VNLKVKDLMAEQVITAQPHHTVSHVRKLMEANGVHAVPIVASDESLAGVVTTADLAAKLKDATPISKVMTERVYTIPAYNDVHLAARLMRNHHCHHVVVTHEQKVVGILSSMDLLELVEEHRFVMKPGPAPRKKAKKQQETS